MQPEATANAREIAHACDERRAGNRRERPGYGDPAGRASGKRLEGDDGPRQATGNRAHFGRPCIGGRGGECAERGSRPRWSAGRRREKGSRGEHAAVGEDLKCVAFVALLDNSADARLTRARA